jgi:hypothetical protein
MVFVFYLVIQPAMPLAFQYVQNHQPRVMTVLIVGCYQAESNDPKSLFATNGKMHTLED